MIKQTFTSTIAAIVLSASFTGGSVLATTLTGSGDHLPLPMPAGVMPTFVSPTLTDDGTIVIGTWESPADPDWRGTFAVEGPYPSSPNLGLATFDFSGLSSTYLPENTFLIFGDLDSGSGIAEQFELRAFDTTPSMNLITEPWLSEPIATWNFGSTDPNAMPRWEWNESTGTYTFDGSTEAFPGNPNLAFALLSEMQISKLEIDKNTTNYGFSLGSPVFTTTVATSEPTPILGFIFFGILGTVSTLKYKLKKTEVISQG